jgi:hypothetical protein
MRHKGDTKRDKEEGLSVARPRHVGCATPTTGDACCSTALDQSALTPRHRFEYD